MKASKDIDRARYHLRYQESQDSSWDFQLLFELFAGFVIVRGFVGFLDNGPLMEDGNVES